MRFLPESDKPSFTIRKMRYLIIILLDILVFNLVTFLINLGDNHQNFLGTNFLFFGIPLWISLSYLNNRYHEFFKKFTFENFLKSFLRTGINFSILNIFLLLFILIFGINISFSIYSMKIFLISIFTLVLEILINFILGSYEYKKKYLFIGDYGRFKLLNSELFNFSQESIDFLEYKNISKIDKNIKNYHIYIVDDLYKISDSQINNLVDLKEKGKLIMDVYQWCEMELKRMPSFIFKKETLTKKFRTRKNYLRFKRFGDIFFSLVMFSCLLPIMVVIALLILLEDGFPIIYSQIRVGNFGKEFRIFKFRSMRRDSEKDGVKWSSRNDNRITKIGKVLRLTRLDEIPQLFCVLKGDMSLIGPRPERPEFEIILEKEIPFYKLRHLIKPGLSGWAQVNYPYGASIKDSNNKLSYDLYYLNHRSLILDFLIFFKTIKLVLNIENSLPIKVD